MGKRAARKEFDWFPFYHDDWLTSVSVNACSLAAQGALARFLCYAYKVADEGFLHYHGRRASRAEVTKILGVLPKFIEELVKEGCLVEKDGALTSPRAAVELVTQVALKEFYHNRAVAGGQGKKQADEERARLLLEATQKEPSRELEASLKQPTRKLETETETETEQEEETNKKAKPAPTGPVSVSDPQEDITEGVRQVFARWQDLWALSAKARLTPKRVKRIRKAIQEFGVEGVLLCLEGWRRDKWKERHTMLHNHDLEVLLRTSEKIEAGQAMAGSLGVRNPEGAKTDRELHPEDYFSEDDLTPEQLKLFNEKYDREPALWIKDFGLPEEKPWPWEVVK